MTIILPFPPTTNTYWRHVNGRTIISRDGRSYRKTVCDLAMIGGVRPIDGRLSVSVTAHPPDRRRRDLDNLMKALLDSLQHAGAYHDDSQIDRLVIERGEVQSGGSVVVSIEAMD